MENLLPTLTIIMAEIALVLLILLLVLLYRYGRRKRLHQAEIETLMEIAQERRIPLPGGAAAAGNTAAKRQTAQAAVANPPPAEAQAESGQAESATATAAAAGTASDAAAAATGEPSEEPQEDARAAVDSMPSAEASLPTETENAELVIDATASDTLGTAQPAATESQEEISTAIDGTPPVETSGRTEIESTDQATTDPMADFMADLEPELTIVLQETDTATGNMLPAEASLPTEIERVEQTVTDTTANHTIGAEQTAVTESQEEVIAAELLTATDGMPPAAEASIRIEIDNTDQAATDTIADATPELTIVLQEADTAADSTLPLEISAQIEHAEQTAADISTIDTDSPEASEIPAWTSALAAVSMPTAADDEENTTMSPAPHSDISHDIGEIHHAMDLMEIKLAQIRHEQNKLALNVQRALEKAAEERAAMHREVSAIAHLISDLRRHLTQPGGNRSAEKETVATAPHRAEHYIETTTMGAPISTAEPITEEITIAAAEPRASTIPATLDDPDYELDTTTLDRLMNTNPFSDLPGAGIDVQEIDLNELDIGDPHGLTQNAKRPFAQDADQIFFQSSTTANMKQGWYFSLRGSYPQGPFGDKQTAERALAEMQGKAPRAGRAGA